MLKRRWVCGAVLSIALMGVWTHWPGFVSAVLEPRDPMELGVICLNEREATAWTKEQWTGDNQPFEQVREDLSGVTVKKLTLPVLLARYKALAKQNPADPVAQFRWGYTAYLMLESTMDGSMQHHILYGVREALGRASPPCAYDYARLRFLIEGCQGRVYGLDEVGERLRVRRPDDYAVLYYLVGALDQRPDIAAKRKALGCALRLVQLRPDLPHPYSALGGVYQRMWDASHDKRYAASAISAYKTYLDMAPASYTWRPMAERMIKIIQMGEAEQQAKASSVSSH